MLRFRSALILFAGILALAASGCNLSQFDKLTAVASILPAIQGTLHGGQQPISGALIQLYTANATVSMGASTPLLSSAVLTNANGGFTINGGYTCSSGNTLVYIVATGGNPGLTGTVNNTAIAEMAAIGTCSTLASATFISVNELTTVAAVQSLGPFMADYAHVGANASNSTGLTIAFNSATAFVNTSTGQFNGNFSSGVMPPTALMNTLADILAACINSSGGTAGDGTNCGSLFKYTTSNANTVAALLSIVSSPTANVAQLFGLVPSAGPFQPTLSSLPNSWAAPAVLPLGNMPDNVSYYGEARLLSDSQGHIWLLQPSLGTVTQYDNTLNVLHTFTIGQAGTESHMSLDPYDNLWVSYGAAALLKIGGNGVVLSPTTGYSVYQPGLTAYPQVRFTTDAFGNVWGLAIRSSDSAFCLIEYSNTGSLISPPTGYCGSQISSGVAATGVAAEEVIADSLGNVYLVFLGSGNNVPLEVFYSSGSYTDLPTHNGGISSGGYLDAIFDPRYQRIWAKDPFLFNLNLNGTINFTTTATSATITTAGFNGLAVDGQGNFWAGGGTGLIEYSPTGVLLLGCTAPYPACLNINEAYTGVFDIYSFYGEGITVDPAGDVFVIDATAGALLRFQGLASAK